MAAQIDDRVRRRLDGPNMAHVASVDRTGRPRVQPVWVGTDGEYLLINTQEGRTWPKRVRRDPRISVSIANAEMPAEYVEIVGSVVAETTEGAKAQLDQLSRVYTGADYPNHFEGEVRVIFQIQPERINYVNLLERVPGVPAQETGR
jgi:PPOX class probable F420-dependent enzyme